MTGGSPSTVAPGLLAVLGPRRMSYQRAFHGMDILREALEPGPGRDRQLICTDTPGPDRRSAVPDLCTDRDQEEEQT